MTTEIDLKDSTKSWTRMKVLQIYMRKKALEMMASGGKQKEKSKRHLYNRWRNTKQKTLAVLDNKKNRSI